MSPFVPRSQHANQGLLTGKAYRCVLLVEKNKKKNKKKHNEAQCSFINVHDELSNGQGTVDQQISQH